MQNYIDLSILVDESGSMEPIRNDMEQGFKYFIDKEKEQNLPIKISVYYFSDSLREDLICKDLKDVNGITIKPNGSTALIDSMCQVIDKTGERLSKMCECDRPMKVQVLVITDGENNSSHLYSSSDLKKRIEHQTNVYNWDFIYLGANVDAFAVAKQYGIRGQSTMNYCADTRGIEKGYQKLFTAHSGICSNMNVDNAKTLLFDFGEHNKVENDKISVVTTTK